MKVIDQVTRIPQWKLRTTYNKSTLGSHFLHGRFCWKYWRASFLDFQLSLLEELRIIIRDRRDLISFPVATLAVIIVDSTRISPMIPAEARFGWNSAAVSTLVWISHQTWRIREKNRTLWLRQQNVHKAQLDVLACNSTERIGQHQRPSHTRLGGQIMMRIYTVRLKLTDKFRSVS